MVDHLRRVAGERRERQVRREDIAEAVVRQKRGVRRNHPLPHRHIGIAATRVRAASGVEVARTRAVISSSTVKPDMASGSRKES